MEYQGQEAEAVEWALNWAFNSAGLHRVEMNIPSWNLDVAFLPVLLQNSHAHFIPPLAILEKTFLPCSLFWRRTGRKATSRWRSSHPGRVVETRRALSMLQ
jgi:hypothetical protein